MRLDASKSFISSSGKSKLKAIQPIIPPNKTGKGYTTKSKVSWNSSAKGRKISAYSSASEVKMMFIWKFKFMDAIVREKFKWQNIHNLEKIYIFNCYFFCQEHLLLMRNTQVSQRWFASFNFIGAQQSPLKIIIKRKTTNEKQTTKIKEDMPKLFITSIHNRHTTWNGHLSTYVKVWIKKKLMGKCDRSR